MAEQKKLKKITSSVIGRSFRLAKLSLSTGTNLAAFGAKHLLSANKEAQLNQFLQQQTAKISLEFGELKGSIMKAGQLLSMYGEHFLPPEANLFLKQLQANSPPLSWEPIEKTLQQNFTAEQLSLLEIDHTPLGAASLGQTHLATILATGEKIVLKIQYPGVERAIDSDLRAIKSILKLLQLLPRGLNTDPLFSEVRQMLIQETDYLREAEMTECFAKLLHNDHRYIVPKVYRQFSNKKILATSYEHGLSPDAPEVIALPQLQRNQLSLNFIDLYFTELFKWQLVQTDPHLGNYRIRLSSSGHDQLVLLDFGATKKFDLTFLSHYRNMIAGALHNNEPQLLAAAEALGFTEASDAKELIRHFRDFCFTTVEPFLTPDDPRLPTHLMNAQGEYSWTKSDLPQRLLKAGYTIIKNFPLRSPPQEVLFLDRKTGGVFIFCSVLNAKIRARELLTKWL